MFNTLPNNTFGITKQDLDYEVGDIHEPDFKPQVKLKKWDNEANFSFRLIEPRVSNVINDENFIGFANDSQQTNFYTVGDDFEFEIYLKKKPVSNVLDFTMQQKNVRFTYQGELTQEEIDDGCVRPAHVVGSYAVYHVTKKNNQYKTGKIAHIYRPWAEDGEGKRVWCTLNINAEQNLATITIPQDFLNTAIYPVKVDPTFGNTTVGGTQWTSASYTLAVLTSDNNEFGYTASTGDAVTTMHVYMGSSGKTVVTAIYDTSSGIANNKVGGNSSNIVSDAAGWFTDAHSVNLTNGTEYVMAVGGWSGGVDMYYDTNASNVLSRESDSGALGDPYTSGSSRTYEMSMYVTYTTAGGGNVYQVNIGDDWKTIAGMQINIGDTWHAVEGLQINIGDDWKTIF